MSGGENSDKTKNREIKACKKKTMISSALIVGII